MHSLLVSRGSKLAFEDYYYRFNGDVPFGIQSVTKSLVSALTGIAVERGELTVNDSLCHYMRKYQRVACTPANKSILLKSVLRATGFVAGMDQRINFTNHKLRRSN